MTEGSDASDEADERRYVSAGRIARAHGVRGLLRATPSIDSPERFLPGKEVFVYRRPAPEPGDPGWRRLRVESVRRTAGTLLLKLAGVDSRTEAEKYSGFYMFVPTAELPGLPGGSYYTYRLCRMTVQSESGDRLGRVRDVWDLPAHPVLVIESESGEEVLIPFLRNFVREVDEENLRVIVAETPGLLGPE